MRSKLAIFCSAILLSLTSLAWAQSTETTACFTLQVASFPDPVLAEKLVARLQRAGEKPAWGTVEIAGRGKWTRVFVGSFKTVAVARLYGEELIERRVISDYLVKTTYDVASLSRPRIISTRDLNPFSNDTRLIRALVSAPEGDPATVKSALVSSSSANPLRVNSSNASMLRVEAAQLQQDILPDGFKTSMVMLPVIAKVKLTLAPSAAVYSIPRPDPARMAFNLIVGASAVARGGLWVTGDRTEGLSRLRWIVGSENAGLVSLDESGRVKLNRRLLLRAAGASDADSLETPLILADYINSNEGLLLLVQLSQGQYRYCLHLGRQAQTAGGVIEVTGSANLDTNYDSRINPYRHDGKKLNKELPPEEFDSLIAINPVARWFNLRTNSLVPVAHITFHELAEAHAKLELRLDYLEQGSQPGAHDTAILREERLKSQRPLSDVILTLGSNRVLRSEEEFRKFYAEGGDLGGNRR